MIVKEVITHLPPSTYLKVLFQDESAFGRISDRRRCWAPMHERPIVGQQVIREFIYAMAAICPESGQITSLVMPWVDTEVMSIFLTQVSIEFKDAHCLMFLDGAGWHTAKGLRMPKNITLSFFPSYSPELNPVEHIWEHLRENYFGNQSFDSLDEVEDALCSTLHTIGEDYELVSSLTYFDWLKTITLTSN